MVNGSHRSHLIKLLHPTYMIASVCGLKSQTGPADLHSRSERASEGLNAVLYGLHAGGMHHDDRSGGVVALEEGLQYPFLRAPC